MKRSFALLSIALLALGTATAYAGNVVEGFEGTDFPPGGWSLSGSVNLWLRSTGCSGYGVGSASALADFYNISSGSQNLITLTFYPSVAGDTVRFAFAYAPYSSSYRDSLVIAASTNGGTTWTQLGALSWADSTAKSTTSQFVPTAAQWATKKYALPVGSNKVRFTGISKYGNEMYVDSVRISGQNAPHDVGVSTIVAPGKQVPGKVALAPQCKVKNYGQNTESFNTTLTIDQVGGSQVYNQTLAVTNLAVGATQTLTFPNWTPDSGEYYNITSWSALAGDQLAANDTLRSTTNTWFTSARVLCEYFTATSCPPCVTGNDSLNHVYADLKDSMAVVRTHVWWPTNNDPYYLGRGTDSMENRARVTYYGVSGVPTGVFSGKLTPDWTAYRSTVLSEKKTKRPIGVALSGWYSQSGDSGMVRAKVTGTGRLSGAKATLTLRYAIVEDSSMYTGTNGDPEHYQVLRDMLPTNSGVSISVDKGTVVRDSQRFKMRKTGGNPYFWNDTLSRFVVWVQNDATKEVLTSQFCTLLNITPLAVELSAFTAEAGNGAVTLRWKTESETDNYQWLVERSASADQGFERIAALPAANSPNGRSYSYTDATASPGQDYYYRLGDQDLGGTITWSNAVFVSGAGTVVAKAWLGPVHPNPCKGQAVIQYGLPRPGAVALRVYDVCGRLVRVLRGGAEGAGIKQQPWDLTDDSGRAVANGVYFYKLDTGYFTATRKLMVVR